MPLSTIKGSSTDLTDMKVWFIQDLNGCWGWYHSRNMRLQLTYKATKILVQEKDAAIYNVKDRFHISQGVPIHLLALKDKDQIRIYPQEGLDEYKNQNGFHMVIKRMVML